VPDAYPFFEHGFVSHLEWQVVDPVDGPVDDGRRQLHRDAVAGHESKESIAGEKLRASTHAFLLTHARHFADDAGDDLGDVFAISDGFGGCSRHRDQPWTAFTGGAASLWTVWRRGISGKKKVTMKPIATSAAERRKARCTPTARLTRMA